MDMVAPWIYLSITETDDILQQIPNIVFGNIVILIWGIGSRPPKPTQHRTLLHHSWPPTAIGFTNYIHSLIQWWTITPWCTFLALNGDSINCSHTVLHIIKLMSFLVMIWFGPSSGKLKWCRYFHHVLRYSRTMYIILSLVRHRITRRLTRL